MFSASMFFFVSLFVDFLFVVVLFFPVMQKYNVGAPRNILWGFKFQIP